MLPSVLPQSMRGEMFITGYRGKGKTFLASQADFPPNIAFFDFEDKGEGLHNQLEFGYYKAISQSENTPLARGKFLLNEIEGLPSDKFTVAIFDNIKPLEASLRSLVINDIKHYAKLYDRQDEDVRKDRFGAQRGIVNNLISDAILKPLYAKGINLVIVTSHIKQRWNNAGPIPNKMKMDGKEKWQELSILTLILIDGDNHPIPSAIVQKEQLASISCSDEDIEAIKQGKKPLHTITRRLPDRLSQATFQSINRYLHSPVDYANLKDGEKLVESEVLPFSEQLSNEQIAFQLLAMENQNREEKELEEIEAIAKKLAAKPVIEAIRTMADDPPVMVLNAIKAKIKAGEIEYDGEIEISDINEWRNND